MLNKRFDPRWFLVSAFLWLAAGCGGTAVSTPQPATPSPTAVTPRPSATATLAPSLTPTATPTAPPTQQATSTPTSTPTAAITAPPPIEGLIDPDNFPANVNPLTGEVVRDPAVLARRPLAIKVSNHPVLVRPQSGLNSADLVFEHYVEAGFTRFTAVFYSHDADPVGSVRSGRLIDLEIPNMYDAAFAYSGSSGPVRLMFKESEFFNRLISIDFGHSGFYRVEEPDRPLVHSLFTDTPTLRYLLAERGEEVPPQFQNGMTFRDEPLTPGEPASSVEIQYQGTNAFWGYDEGNGRYLRWSDGQPHLDANTGEQLSFKNIIVVSAEHVDTDIIEDTGGSHSIQIQIWGEGPVSIFRNGQRFDGLWHRDEPHDMLTFTDKEGAPLPLAPGNSFFQIVPSGFDDLFVTP
ncbi:MAG: DUF3048 domain-containing protein [Anaerolineales bacterium]|nr:DUF3048 domain-containing protein [Anaerolineales bacterium]